MASTRISVGKYGEEAIVDVDMLEELASKRWYVRAGGYPITHIDGNPVEMHRFIVNAPPGHVTDHVNGDKLDNRRENLRVATWAQNAANRPSRKRSERGHPIYRGVDLRPSQKWRAKITANRHSISLGYYSDPRMAALAYNYAARFYFGEFARLNEIAWN